MLSIPERIAAELSVRQRQVEAAVSLLDEGATVPFVARYRKEATGGLDDTQLRTLEERLRYLRDLEDRRAVVLKSIAEQGKLTPELEAQLLEADTKVRLEDLYLPYRPKRRTKAQIAREAGLEPLALALLGNPTLSPVAEAAKYVARDKGVSDPDAALDGARHILMEMFAEDAELAGILREQVWQKAVLSSRVVAGKEEEGVKFSDYFNANEPLKGVPSHRALAVFRGRNEGVLKLSLETSDRSAFEDRISERFRVTNRGRPADAWLLSTVASAWEKRIFPRLETELEGRLRERAEEEAIKVFGKNLGDLLLAAPAGARSTMGLDPGFRTGVKVAVIEATGKVLATSTIYPHAPKNDWAGALSTLAELSRRHHVELAAVGNGTASRETAQLVDELVRAHPDLTLTRVVVSEAGASVYSASEIAAHEHPDLDVSLRGAVSIARRLQDPLAELVKIDPKSIGVGQYQHDVDQPALSRKLDAVVEDCVNGVGVDVNTASAPLLARVAGLNFAVASNVVRYRNENGAFRTRSALGRVPRLGPKAFEQAAGFLRIRGEDEPLDASAVHPEAYPVVERILRATGAKIQDLVGNRALIETLRAGDFVDQRFGEPTVKDIFSELLKPGRDPRPEFRAVTFKEGIDSIEQLAPDMVLEGVVTNVTNFGAFIDVGVHQDGLVHVSAMAEGFVKDPSAVVKAGDVVKVKVVDVDLKRKRISLTMRMGEKKARVPQEAPKRQPKKKTPRPAPPPRTAMADAFSKLKRS